MPESAAPAEPVTPVETAAPAEPMQQEEQPAQAEAVESPQQPVAVTETPAPAAEPQAIEPAPIATEPKVVEPAALAEEPQANKTPSGGAADGTPLLVFVEGYVEKSMDYIEESGFIEKSFAFMEDAGGFIKDSMQRMDFDVDEGRYLEQMHALPVTYQYAGVGAIVAILLFLLALIARGTRSDEPLPEGFDEAETEERSADRKFVDAAAIEDEFDDEVEEILHDVDDEVDFDLGRNFDVEPVEELNIDESTKLAELEAVLDDFESRYAGDQSDESQEEQSDEADHTSEDVFEAETDDATDQEAAQQDVFDEDVENLSVDDGEPSLDNLDFDRDFEGLGDEDDDLFTGEIIDGATIPAAKGPGKVVDKVREMENDHWNLREEERQVEEESQPLVDDTAAEESFKIPELEAEPDDELQAEESGQDDLLDFDVDELLMPRDEGGRTDIGGQEEQSATVEHDSNTIDFEIFSDTDTSAEEEPLEAAVESAEEDLDSILDDFTEASEEDIDLLAGTSDEPAEVEGVDLLAGVSDAPAVEESDDLLADFDADSQAEAVESAAEPSSDDVDTMIDLAKVSITMGDTDGARGMLEEALEKGNATQKSVINELIEQLG
ncbi:hypothetical protein BOW31_01010 [Solemya velum gill symbiont]|uniref:FimV/HubP family polar landmark protein n=1 Tax=Solemya velum gill symbiont TaxID=2340 RepID=UPI000997012C|nr:FimV/HubP family polar landmark protein [Solemya velum gill symbiont]OOZ25373.1 hypothetical protein BOW31_01010 [Solemya velum gill symbiont]